MSECNVTYNKTFIIKYGSNVIIYRRDYIDALNSWDAQQSILHSFRTTCVSAQMLEIPWTKISYIVSTHYVKINASGPDTCFAILSDAQEQLLDVFKLAY